MITIKYEIFEDDVEDLRKIDLVTFDEEYSEIYGNFTVIIDEEEFIPYPSDTDSLSDKRFYSELILTHFSLLNQVLKLINKEDYIALKYVENSTDWLEFKVKKDSLIISFLNYDERNIPSNRLICTNERFFKRAKYGLIKQRIVSKNNFENELKEKTSIFLEEIKRINPSILKSKSFYDIL